MSINLCLQSSKIRFHFVYLDLMKCNYQCADVYRLVKRREICSLMKKLCFLLGMMIDCRFVSVKCSEDMDVCHRYFFWSRRKETKKKKRREERGEKYRVIHCRSSTKTSRTARRHRLTSDSAYFHFLSW